MLTKSLEALHIKSAARGEVTAVFSTFNVIDADDDVTLPGAFDDGAQVRISAYGHKSWEGALPVGKGTIRQGATEAVLDGRFFLDTVGGRDTFTVVKELGELGEWSFGYDVVKSHPGKMGNRAVRYLEKLKVHEVSPVLVGAGVGTRTLAAKHRSDHEAGLKEYLRFVALQAGVPPPVDLEREHLRFLRSQVHHP